MVRLRCDERGAAAVELALVLPPLLLLLFGIVEFSRVFYTQLRLQQAAQQGVRQMALHYDDLNLTDDGLTDLVNDTLSDALGGVAAGELSDLVKLLNSCTVNPPAPQDAKIILQDQIQVASLLDIDPITVTGSATMPCEG